jgi:ATP:corrinoid adenosyltransferase
MVDLNTTNALVREGIAPTNSFTGSIAPKTGLLRITFGNGNGTNTTAGTGAVLQNANTGGGFFITTTNAGAISLTPLP